MTPARFRHYRRASLLSALVLMLALLLSPLGAAAYAQEPAPSAETSAKAAEADEHHESGWGSTIAKAVNFAILVGVLAYFLKAPIVDYLKSRGETIRKDQARLIDRYASEVRA